MPVHFLVKFQRVGNVVSFIYDKAGTVGQKRLVDYTRREGLAADVRFSRLIICCVGRDESTEFKTFSSV